MRIVLESADPRNGNEVCMDAVGSKNAMAGWRGVNQLLNFALHCGSWTGELLCNCVSMCRCTSGQR